MIDVLFGEGIARGTDPCETGGGVNVLIDWLGPNAKDKPKSRGAINLTLKFDGGSATGMRVVSKHTGQDFVSGAVHRARGCNDEEAASLFDESEVAGLPSPIRTPPKTTTASLKRRVLAFRSKDREQWRSLTHLRVL